MRDKLTSALVFALLLALVAGTWWASDYARRSIPIDPPRRYTHEMDTFIEFFVMMQIDETGMPAARLEGPRAEHFPDDDSYLITSPRAVSQRPDRTVTVATAQRGLMTDEGAHILMQEDVRFHRESQPDEPGLTIESQEITLLPDTDVAYTELPAIITRADGSQITGTGMHYDNRTRQLKIAADARVRIAPPATSGDAP